MNPHRTSKKWDREKMYKYTYIHVTEIMYYQLIIMEISVLIQ